MNIGPRKHRRLGFTLVEAMVAVVLLGGGIATVIGAYGAIAKGEARLRESEAMQQLAIQKYDEMVATGQTTASQSGDFSDRNNNDYVWTIEIQPSGITDLSSISVTVKKRSESSNSVKQTVTGLLYIPPTTSTTGATQ